MGKVLEEISEREAAFIERQKVFFVATAALDAEHHVSVSPKAPGDSCVVLDAHTVAYADLTGSGAEAAAHVCEPGNGRMTLMFCNLEAGPPKILRLHGKATMMLAEDVPDDLRKKFPEKTTSSFGFRAVYTLDVHRISTSCGYSLPQMTFQKYRSILDEYTEKEGKEGMFNYATKKNSFSIDGLPSLALQRKNAPKNVQPYVENGFILAKVSEEGDTATADSKAIAKNFNKSKKVGTIKLTRTQLVGFGALCIASGILIGTCLTNGGTSKEL